jgi:hypothetical protein
MLRRPRRNFAPGRRLTVFASRGEAMTEKKQEPKTAQPFSDELKDTSSPGVGREPRPAADAIGDPKKKAQSPKTTQRTE